MWAIRKLIARLILPMLPLIRFPRLNVALNRMLGYDIHRSARLYSSVQIRGNIQVSVGPRTFIGHETLITGGAADIIIGEDCDISDRVTISCGTHEIDSIGPRSAGAGTGKDVTIGNGVWIGIGAIIIPGITIGDKAIIGAGSVVTRNVSPRTIVAGNPARVIREL